VIEVVAVGTQRAYPPLVGLGVDYHKALKGREVVDVEPIFQYDHQPDIGIGIRIGNYESLNYESLVLLQVSLPPSLLDSPLHVHP